MSKIYDCIVVGAGPAGGTCAYHLAKKGHDVLILEKERLPRYKPCGGGISPVIAQWFDFDFSPVISTKTKKFKYTWVMGDPVDVELDEPIWMVKRDEFDHFLVKQAQRQGAALQEGCKVGEVNFTGESWLVNSAQGEFFGKYLVCADGSKGQLAKWIGLGERKRLIGGAIEAEAEVAKEDNTAYFEFGMVKYGYLWNFPKAYGSSFGIGVFRGTDHQNLKKILASYARAFNIDLSKTFYVGHPLYIWDGVQNLHSRNKRAVVAGESACLVDPLTAEGIRPSILSGVKAAEAVHGAISNSDSAIEKYTETIKREIGQDLRWAELLAKVLYNFPGFCYKRILKNPSASRIMGKIFCGEMRYRDLPLQLLLKIGKLFA